MFHPEVAIKNIKNTSYHLKVDVKRDIFLLSKQMTPFTINRNHLLALSFASINEAFKSISKLSV